jgi:hypothetical protein
MVTKASRASRGALRCECTEEALISPSANALLLNRLASQDANKIPTLEPAEVPTACSMGCPLLRWHGHPVAVRLVVAHGVGTTYDAASPWCEPAIEGPNERVRSIDHVCVCMCVCVCVTTKPPPLLLPLIAMPHSLPYSGACLLCVCICVVMLCGASKREFWSCVCRALLCPCGSCMGALCETLLNVR